ncbi:MAG: hypothetical protein DF168_02207 [Candidatus Moanabacter tarae]|uniref:Uncharacterized protein n=1 Tax=Candidatus Moanibacter tarae TaxID=2200854 RepID=A0A2Z4AS58_9BACT|nr:MAG: hypothetical protein DF168_02207 [Candidatus Moanabacter tarae]
MTKIDQWFLLLLTNPVVFDHYSAQIFKKGVLAVRLAFFLLIFEWAGVLFICPCAK